MNYGRNLRDWLERGASRLVLSIGEDDGDNADPGGGAGAGGDEGAGGGEPAGDSGGDAGPSGDGAGGGGDPNASAEGAADADGGADPAPAKPTRVPWQTKRIDKLTAEAKAAAERAERAEREASENKRQLEAYRALYGDQAVPPADTPAGRAHAAEAAPAQPGGGRVYTEAEFNAAVAAQAATRDLNQRCDRMWDDGAKAYGKAWESRIQAVAESGFAAELAKRPDFFDAVTSLPNGAAVYNELIGDLDHLSEVLTMNPLKLGMELASISNRLGSAKPKAPQVSKAPAPITPVEGNAGEDFDPESASMDDYYKDFERRREARAAARN